MRIVLLHGLLSTPLSMRALIAPLERDGHEVHSLGYPSHRLSHRGVLLNVADRLRQRGLLDGGDELGFVAHSMGGLVWRDLPRVVPGFETRRAVLLGSPLHGSVVARALGRSPLARMVLGAAMHELRDTVEASATYPGPFATVAGTRWSPLIPAAHIMRRVAPDEPSDSTVLVREARSTRAVEHVEVDSAHTLLPSHPRTIAFVRAFLVGESAADASQVA